MERENQINSREKITSRVQESKTDQKLRRATWAIMTVGGIVLGFIGMVGEVARVAEGEFGEYPNTSRQTEEGLQPWFTDAMFIGSAGAGLFLVGIGRAIRRKGNNLKNKQSSKTESHI